MNLAPGPDLSSDLILCDQTALFEAKKARAYILTFGWVIKNCGFECPVPDHVCGSFLISLLSIQGDISALAFDCLGYLGNAVYSDDNRLWANDLVRTHPTPFGTTMALFEAVASYEKNQTAEFTAITNRLHMPGPSALCLSAFQTLGLYAVALEGDPSGLKIRALTDYLKKTQQLLTDLGVAGSSHGQPHPDPLLTMQIPQLRVDAPRNETPAKHTLAGLIQELDGMTGLQNVKHEVMSLINLARVGHLRLQQGLPEIPITLHLVFTGNPGTGKTTVARLIAQIYKELGLVSKGQLVETDRAGLVAGYVGQTALKVKAKVDEALGGILFIDEAYSLTSTSGEDFGKEAIEVLLKSMEDYRTDLVVIAAGYSEQMSGFLNANPGLKSRFGRVIEFEDYSSDDLFNIFVSMSQSENYVITEPAKPVVRQTIERIHMRRGPNFANAREIRNLLDAVVAQQSSRVAAMASPTRDDLVTIIETDLPGTAQ